MDTKGNGKVMDRFQPFPIPGFLRHSEIYPTPLSFPPFSYLKILHGRWIHTFRWIQSQPSNTKVQIPHISTFSWIAHNFSTSTDPLSIIPNYKNYHSNYHPIRFNLRNNQHYSFILLTFRITQFIIPIDYFPLYDNRIQKYDYPPVRLLLWLQSNQIYAIPSKHWIYQNRIQKYDYPPVWLLLWLQSEPNLWNSNQTPEPYLSTKQSIG